MVTGPRPEARLPAPGAATTNLETKKVAFSLGTVSPRTGTQQPCNDGKPNIRNRSLPTNIGQTDDDQRHRPEAQNGRCPSQRPPREARRLM
mmetsp:Transcript_81764/g.136681  ORF Transcript_81764/g.136681 Transcript_81764/m.136681 type:complete len:91 (+) Transcript_81764:57-329(+)